VSPPSSSASLSSLTAAGEARLLSHAGRERCANANPEQIDGPGLLQSIQVERLPDAAGSASEHLGIISRLIEDTLAREVPDENPRKSIYAELVRQNRTGHARLQRIRRVSAFVHAGCGLRHCFQSRLVCDRLRQSRRCSVPSRLRTFELSRGRHFRGDEAGEIADVMADQSVSNAAM